jgi:hypothetical protein
VANASRSLTPEADTHPLNWQADIELLYKYALGVRREKAALFQWVQIPPGNRSSRK